MDFSFFTQLDVLGKFFWLAAICGTLFFILRTVLMFSGGDIDDGVDARIDEGSDAAFEVLSINGITAFVMMFGWAGLTAYLQYKRSAGLSLLIAFFIGVVSMLMMAWLFHLSRKMVSHGATLNVNDLVGLTASVYQTIPAEGIGKITVSVASGGTREWNAVSAEKTEIASFTSVKIVKVIDSQTVTVQKI
jgi:membrane protein implicated in regulation of membrane protease activity